MAAKPLLRWPSTGACAKEPYPFQVGSAGCSQEPLHQHSALFLDASELSNVDKTPSCLTSQPIVSCMPGHSPPRLFPLHSPETKLTKESFVVMGNSHGGAHSTAVSLFETQADALLLSGAAALGTQPLLWPSACWQKCWHITT